MLQGSAPTCCHSHQDLPVLLIPDWEFSAFISHHQGLSCMERLVLLGMISSVHG